MNKLSRRTLIASGGAAMALATTQLKRPGQAIAQNSSKGVVNLYSSRHYNTDDELYQTFTQKTGIKVNLIEAKASQLLERLKAEGSNSPADVFMTVDATGLWKAEKAGIFGPVSSTVINSRIPASLRHPSGLWFGFSKRARVIMYSKDRVNPAELSTYEALADPKWRGKIAIRSSSNVYNQSLVSSLLLANGTSGLESWMQGFVQNFARPPEGNDRAQIEAVASGLADIAIANTYYLPRYKKSDDPAKQDIFNKIGVFFPNQNGRGAHVNIGGAGLVKTSPNRDNAIKFLEYLSSPIAQVFFAQGNNEYPAVAGTPIDPVVAGFGAFKSDDINVAKFGTYNKAVVEMMDRIGWI